jgi:replicative DNA helicase
MSTAPVNPTDRNPIPFGGGGGGRGRNQRPEIHASLQKLFDRMPPQSLEAEMSLLGSMILDPRVISDVLSHVRSPEDFYKPAHGIIFQTILEISDRHHMGEADLVLLFERLRDRGISDEIGGASYLRELAESVPVATNAVYYAKTVSEKARLRRLIDAAGQMLYDAYHLGDLGADAAQQVVDHAEKAIFDIAHSSETNDPEALAILLKREMDRIDAADGTMSGLATGFYELDKLLRGLQPGEMIILAARPSMGKTAFALNIAEQISMGEAAEQANPSEPLALALFSLEMSKAAVSLRLLSARAGVNGGKLRTGSLHDEEYDRLFAAYRELSRSPMYIDDSAGLTIMQLRARARRLAAKHNIKLIIVDYLQLLTAPGSGRESRQVEVSEISRGIKALSRDLNVPIICLSQLNRASEQREGNRPRMSDLRESGSIEQDADVIMLLHREDYYHRGEPSWDPMHPDFNEENRDKLDTAEVIVAKQRNGPTGIVKLKWDKEVTKFRNYDPHATPPPDFAADYNQSRRPAGGFAPGGKPSGGYSSVGQSGGQGGGSGGSSGTGYSSPSSAAEQFPGNPPKRTGFPSSRPTGPVSNFRDGGGPDKDGPAPTDPKRAEPPPFDEDDLGNIPV